MKNADRHEFEQLRRELGERLGTLAAATVDIMEPLRTLDDRQRHSLIEVGSLARLLTFAQRPPHRVASGTLKRFQYGIDQVCPDLGKELVSSDPCFDSTLAYVTALKECQDDGKAEEECEDAWGPGSQAVAHVMREIEEIERRIDELGGDGPEPPPLPT